MVYDFEVFEKIEKYDAEGKEYFLTPKEEKEIQWFRDFQDPLKDGGRGRAISTDGLIYKMKIKHRFFYFTTEYRYKIQVYSRCYNIPKEMNIKKFSDVLELFSEMPNHLEFFQKLGEERYKTYFGFSFDETSVTLFFGY